MDDDLMVLDLVLLAIGFLILSAGGHYLVEGATRIALLARVSTAIIGLTVVAFGTSLPELAVSLGAALRGATDISYSNVVGSNIFNIAMILAITAIIRPIAVGQQTLRLEYPFMVLATWLLLLLSRDGVVDRLEGTFFVISLIIFLWYLARLAVGAVDEVQASELAEEVKRTAGNIGDTSPTWGKNLGLIAIGIVGLVVGADLMVRGAVGIATNMGVSQRVIGLTVVAMGTSLPELATSVVAARRGESAIALGNIVGSNIFNILAILGITSTIINVPVNATAIAVDNWVMLGLTVLLLPMMHVGQRLTRRDGFVLLAAFVTYIAWVVLAQ